MRNILKFTAIIAMGVAASTVLTTSCSNDDYDTQQYLGGVNLNVWGPRPVARGGELRFLGSGMDQITAVVIPGSGEVSTINVVSSEEIRIVVPQDAEPGKVKLRHSGGEIESMTELSFLEPISITSLSPMTVKPGASLTISGDYLNLISEVIFTDEVAVDEDDFITHTRSEISLAVPAEACTGKIILSDGGTPIPNRIPSEDELTIVLPSVAKVADLTGAKPGETVTFDVSDLDLVKSVVMPDGTEVDFTAEDGKLSFVLPANISDGTICMIPASGIKVAIATVGVALPEEVVASPAENIWGGDIVKFKGVNMELVTEVTFPGVENGVAPSEISATEITVTVPEGTCSGMAVLHTASGGAVEAAVSTIKPEAVGYNPIPAPLASDVTVSGRNLGHVASITFGGTVKVDVSYPGESEFNVSIPATLSAGSNSVTLTLTNGESVECAPIELTAPECAYATLLPADDAEINAGDMFTITIANADKLTGVEVDRQAVQYILNGERLTIQVPATAGKNSEFTLVSSNGNITYPISVIAATHVENVIFNELRDLGSWAGEGDGGAFRLYKESFEGVPAGSKLVFHVAPYDYAQIQVNDANWGQIVIEEVDQTATTFEMILTQEILDRILGTDDGWSTTALVVQGQGMLVSKVHIEWENSLETVIWDAGWICSGWGGNQDLAWGGYDWSTVKPGTVMRLYTTSTVGDDWWCISLRHGDSWGNLPDPIPSQYDNPASPLEVTLTAGVLDDLVANGGLVITGSEYQLNKITLE